MGNTRVGCLAIGVVILSARSAPRRKVTSPFSRAINPMRFPAKLPARVSERRSAGHYRGGPIAWQARLGRAIAYGSAEQHSAPSPFEGEGWGGGWLFDSAEPRTPSRFAHAKSDVSDLANVHAEIGNCRFRMAREPTSPTRGEVTGVCLSDDPNFTQQARASGARPGLRFGGGRRRDRARLLGRSRLGRGGLGVGGLLGGSRRGGRAGAGRGGA